VVVLFITEISPHQDVLLSNTRKSDGLTLVHLVPRDSASVTHRLVRLLVQCRGLKCMIYLHSLHSRSGRDAHLTVSYN